MLGCVSPADGSDLQLVLGCIQQLRDDLTGLEQRLSAPKAYLYPQPDEAVPGSNTQTTMSFDALLQQLQVAHSQEVQRSQAPTTGSPANIDSLDNRKPPVLGSATTGPGPLDVQTPDKPVPRTQFRLSDSESETPCNGISGEQPIAEANAGGLREAGSSIEDEAKAKGQADMVYKRRKKRLVRIFEVNKQTEQREADRKAVLAERQEAGLVKRVRMFEGHEIELLIDSGMSVVIVLNAAFIGISVDSKEDGTNVWQNVDIAFSVIFVCELVLKCFLHGIRKHFCGRDKCSNTFDASLILCDAVQVITGLTQKAGVLSASLFRVIRLVRLTRLVRLVRTDSFKDLLSMIQGMVSGALTLFWAGIVFFLMVYVMALVCRELFGERQDVEYVYEYFNNVPRSMFTIFKCSFGDCGNTPEYISEGYGGIYAVGYCIFVFMLTIGLFNIISAIFVDSTMSAQADIAAKTSQSRLDDEERWARSVSSVVKELLDATPEREDLSPLDLLADLEKVIKVSFDRATIELVVQSDNVINALDALDIDINDHKRLSDILDPDHSGDISVLELVEGLRRLRGTPRRSDVVTVDLMVRSMQVRVEEILEKQVEHMSRNA